MSIEKKITSGFKSEFLTQLAKIILSGLLIVFLARLLSPEQYGILYLSIAIFSIVILLSSFGLSRSAARYITEYQESAPEQIPHIVRTSAVYTLFAVTAATLTLVLLREPVALVFEEPQLEGLILVGGLYILFESTHGYCRRTLQGFKQIEKSASLSVIEASCRFVFAISLVLLGFGAFGALAGYAIGMAVSSVAGVLTLYPLIKQYSRDSTMETGLRRRIVEYSFPITLTSSGTVLIKRTDILLIGFFLNPVAVGYYTIGKQIIEFAANPANSLGFSISPRYAEQYQQGNPQRAAELYQQALKSIFLLYAAAAVGLVIVAEPTVQYIFGEEYLGAVVVIQILAAYLFIQAVSYVTGSGLDYLGKAKIRGILKVVIAVGNLVLNIILIPIMGVSGAAIATVITYAVYVTGNVYIMHRQLPLNWSEITIDGTKALVVALAMGGVVMFLSGYVVGLISLFAVIGAGFGFWFACCFAVGLIEMSQIRAIVDA
jgi:O-antigen/teichoic acid export membrane protein